MGARNRARLAGLVVVVVGALVAGQADAGWRSRRACCPQPKECCETVPVDRCCCRPAPTACGVAERYEPRVHHHTGCDACGRRVCVEHVTMERVRVAVPVEERVVDGRLMDAGSVCCSW